ncbi:MAG TPA: alpha/beta hydrolase, partial [Xanthobacteraceae bacterium]|nr:alpha/beta hydrolase [Xanthobacteraceae bacterium]
MLDFEAEYNNRARVPEHPAIFARWTRDADNFRSAHANAGLCLSYGRSAREHIDLYWPSAKRDAPIVLFIHGGYWRSLAPAMFSHVAAGANPNGLAVALAGYDLCPDVTIARIIEEVRAAAVFLWRRHGRKLVACGHSAGGHLAACLLATDWKKRAPDLPIDLVPAAFSISGLFDLTPLVNVSMNADLRLDAAEAWRVSPLFWEIPAGDRTLEAWAGGQESSEFLRQSRAIVEAW